MKCALAFDGYGWKEATLGPDARWEDLWAKPLDSMEMDPSLERNFGAFFSLQRWLYKWGGEQLPESAPEHRAYRWLFLHLYRAEIPARWRHAERWRTWRAIDPSVREKHAAAIRRALLND